MTTCVHHGVPIYHPAPHVTVSEPHCPICYVYPRHGEPAGLSAAQLERRERVAAVLVRSLGPLAWGDEEFVQMWHIYQHMTYGPQVSDATDDYMAGMLCGVWTLRALKREYMDEKNLKRRVNESTAALRRAVNWDRGSGLAPELAPKKG